MSLIGKRILVPVDLEQDSFDGIKFVASLAGERSVCATLLHVVNLNITAPDRRVYEDLRREKQQRLQALAKLFFNGSMPEERVRFGKPHEEILAEAEASQAEMIVMGSPKSARKKWRFRPTTLERVIRAAPCLILALPRVWKITPEAYRQAMRPRFDPGAVILTRMPSEGWSS
jgi:nucleotide-binding universal stress UspA family protein